MKLDPMAPLCMEGGSWPAFTGQRGLVSGKPQSKVGGMVGLPKSSWKPHRDLGKISVWEDRGKCISKEVWGGTKAAQTRLNRVYLEAVNRNLLKIGSWQIWPS